MGDDIFSSKVIADFLPSEILLKISDAPEHQIDRTAAFIDLLTLNLSAL